MEVTVKAGKSQALGVASSLMTGVLPGWGRARSLSRPWSRAAPAAPVFCRLRARSSCRAAAPASLCPGTHIGVCTKWNNSARRAERETKINNSLGAAVSAGEGVWSRSEQAGGLLLQLIQ